MAKGKKANVYKEGSTPIINTAELGQVGLRRTSGFIREEFLRELIGKQGVQTYNEMGDNDPVIGAVLFVAQMLIRQVPWNIEAYSQDMEDIRRAEFLSSCMDDMDSSWIDTIIEILSMLQYGWSYHEIVYKMRLGPNHIDGRFRSKFTDGLVGWRKLPIRGQDSLWKWEYVSPDDDKLIGMTQMPAPSWRNITIPINKALLFRPSAHKQNPEGRSILRNAYLPWYYKKNLERIEAIGIERDLAGLPIIRVPPALFDKSNPDGAAALAEYKDIVVNLKRDEQEGVILPNSYDSNGNRLYELELLSSGGARQVNTDVVIQRYDRRIAMTSLADFLFIGHQSTGSFALIDNKTDIFVTAIGSWLDSISDVFNRFAIPRLWRMNKWPLDRIPTLEHGDIESPDLTKLGTYISQLAGSGVNLFPNKKLENWLKRAGGLPVDETIDQENEDTPEPKNSNAGRTSTDGDPPHFHDFIVDDSGNGLTQSVSDGPDHVHSILDGVVKASGRISHTHRLT